jgi:hypothetical protein
MNPSLQDMHEYIRHMQASVGVSAYGRAVNKMNKKTAEDLVEAARKTSPMTEQMQAAVTKLQALVAYY